MKFEIGALYQTKQKISWQLKRGHTNGYFQLLFPSVPIRSDIGDIVLILEEINDNDHNKILLYSDVSYKVLLIKTNEIVYMYVFTKNEALEKITINEN